MIKQMAWNTFKNTGNIDAYLEFVEVENLERKMQEQLNQTIIQENELSRNQTIDIKNNLGDNIGIDTQKWSD